MSSKESVEKLYHKLCSTAVAYDEDNGFAISITDNSGIEWNANEIKRVIRDLKILGIIKRIFDDETSYIKLEPSFYIDGKTKLSSKEKKMIKEWLRDE